MSFAFKIASYNVLANAYAYPKRYAHIDPNILRWDARKIALAKRLASFNTDIICLQEVEKDAYALFEQTLRKKGYEGRYAQKRQPKLDGCAVFFKQEKLRFNNHQTFYYHDGVSAADSGHLALLLGFESEIGSIGIANTHLKWDRANKAKEKHIGCRQITELITCCIQADKATDHRIICGDFNAQPDSLVIQELRLNGFKDAYQGHEQPTANPNHRAKRIDYIFHTAGLQATAACLVEIDDFTPLPSATEPSDHLAIAATMQAAEHPEWPDVS